MTKKFLLTAVIALGTIMTKAQQADTVIVELAKTSQVIFTIKDRNDLEILKHYDFQQLFQDVLSKLEKNDTTALAKRDSTETEEVVARNENSEDEDDDEDDNDWRNHRDDNDDDDDDNDDYEWRNHFHGNRWGRTWQSFNFDLGTNNYLTDGEFPDNNNALYSVRPWGSWYVAASSIQRTRLGSKFFIEWGVGMSWYNFKFQKDNITILKDDNGIEFTEDLRDVNFRKSKLTVSYVHASLVPIVDFGGNSRKARLWDGHHNSFRIGLGPYVGYRISSHSKIVYKDGDREKDKDRDNFYLNNFRYGMRLQLGYRSTDLFFNYDMNELFAEGRGPKLNAFSFGVIF
ncbi:hypothetical protein [Chryseolinea sp. H1M3-3]|uniref:hypothetical protein n=1 Tax=Chryseolinea sp. H1M3-3 TaxID=3034144 RepID=UPI0023EC1F55|nr:hypothetical protein [Chryseolinea sp. H1M3-3]